MQNVRAKAEKALGSQMHFSPPKFLESIDYFYRNIYSSFMFDKRAMSNFEKTFNIISFATVQYEGELRDEFINYRRPDTVIQWLWKTTEL